MDKICLFFSRVIVLQEIIFNSLIVIILTIINLPISIILVLLLSIVKGISEFSDCLYGDIRLYMENVAKLKKHILEVNNE